jgi:tyrosine-protein phosphatase non-receptor type 14/21
LNALNLSNSHISEPIYENVPLPTATSTHVERKISIENQPVRPKPRIVEKEPSMDIVSASTNTVNVNANAFNKGSSKNINDPSKINEIAKKHFMLANNDNNGNSMTGLASISNNNINISQERDVNLNHLPSSAATTASPFHIEANQQIKHRQQINSSSTLMNTSGTSSNYTVNTTTDTTDSGISTEMGGKKESKRSRLWNILGGKNKSSSKQKSATLGREKDKSKKDKKRDIENDEEGMIQHRWSTGLPKVKPLPANISKENLCQILDSKLNDTQLFLEFERIPKRKQNAFYTCALLEENRNKNTDPTCIPMDENRVKLLPTRENRMGYVNASHITVSFYNLQKKNVFFW